MPLLDMSDALLSPEIASFVTVLRRTENVNNFGEASNVVQHIPRVVAVVTNPGPNDLKRLPEYSAGDSVISVVTRYPLRGASQVNPVDNYQPDVILWRGAQYLVQDLKDYTAYGAGFVEALCVETNFTVKAPL